MKNFRSLFVVLVLVAATLACANPLGGNPPTNVETIVAATLQALTAPASDSNTPPPGSTPNLLPHSMYFLNNDNAGFMQVYRLEQDGTTVKQVTFEPDDVTGYDVSMVDGSVAYVSNNQLLNVRTDGSNRSMLVDGGPVDENNPFLNSLSKPVWSPNGQTIAFAYHGLNFYSITSGQSNLVLENIIDTDQSFPFPHELYSPEQYTADGSKLLITLGYYEGSSAAIYYPHGNALVRLNGAEGALICCGETQWTADGSTFYAAYPSLGMFQPGLWRVDAATGNVTTLIAGDGGNGVINSADEPFSAPDGLLYYFFASYTPGQEFVNRPPLQLVRAAADGVTNRTVLRSDTYELMNEALWAPDASFVITAMAPIQDVYQGGAAELVYTDGQKADVPLVPFAMEMKWGP